MKPGLEKLVLKENTRDRLLRRVLNQSTKVSMRCLEVTYFIYERLVRLRAPLGVAILLVVGSLRVQLAFNAPARSVPLHRKRAPLLFMKLHNEKKGVKMWV